MTRIFGFCLLQELPGAAHRAAGAGARDEVRHLAAGLLPDFRAGGPVVRLGIHLIVELVGQHGARGVLDDLLGLHDVVVGVVGRHRGRRDDHLRAVGLEQPHLFLRHLVRHGEDAAVPLERRRDREPDAGVAAGALDDGPARLELAPPLGVLDDGESDPVLDRAAGIGVFRLAVDRRPDAGAHPAQPDQRGPADGVEDVVVGREVWRRHGVVPPAPGWRK